MGVFLVQIWGKHPIDVQFVRIPQELGEQELPPVGCGLDFLLVVVLDGKAHQSFILRGQFLEKGQLVHNLQPQIGVILRLGIVEGLINRILAKPTHIVKQPHDFCQLHIMGVQAKVFRQFNGDRGNVPRMGLLDENALLHLCVFCVEGFHIG